LLTFEFQFEFWGVLPADTALFYPHGAFLSESKTPPGAPVRALVIEKRVQNLVRLADCLFQRYLFLVIIIGWTLVVCGSQSPMIRRSPFTLGVQCPLQLSVSKIWIHILRYELQNLHAKISRCCGPRSPCLNSGYRNRILRYFWTNFKFMI
jgi:hypothetical protein